MKKTLFTRVTFVLSLLLVPLSALGYRYSYRGGPYVNEPRFDRNYLSTFNVSVMGGSAKNGYNGSGDKTNVLNVYGVHNIAKLGQGVPGLNPLNALDLNLIQLAALPSNGNFGKVVFNGKFNYIGATFSFAQNYKYGFFSQINVPVENITVNNISFVDQSPTTGVPNITDPIWTQFLTNFDAVLNRFGTDKGNFSYTSVGDIQAYLGWTYNNDNLKSIDFFDTTIKVGFNSPAANRRDRSKAFAIPLGYNGHGGVSVDFDASIGFLDWVSLGWHVGGQFFFDDIQPVRMKTNSLQSGYIKLAQGVAKEKMGNLWDIGTFLKADHLAGGFSFGVAYTYTSQEDTTLVPEDTVVFDSIIVNSDEMLKGWRKHVFAISADYDFAKEGRCFNPRIGLFYNRPVGGKRIFATDIVGGDFGANITWEF